MTQLKTMLLRLKSPTVLLSIVSQVVTLLVLFKVQVDMTLVGGAVTAISSILVLLGILSDPTTEKKGYGDDIFPCPNCGETGAHLVTGDTLTCKNCGTQHSKTVR
ncbi:MAG: phage holin [Oscillospiraceae bacterium]